MVYLNSSKRARSAAQTMNQCQGGGSKKTGLVSRIVPSAVSLAHSSHRKSISQTLIMMPHQQNVSGSVGVGRRAPIRHSAWNTNGTSSMSMKSACARL